MTRDEIITNMCYTFDHSYGLRSTSEQPILGGYNDRQREALWNQMAQIYDNDITPYHILKGTLWQK